MQKGGANEIVNEGIQTCYIQGKEAGGGGKEITTYEHPFLPLPPEGIIIFAGRTRGESALPVETVVDCRVQSVQGPTLYEGQAFSN